MIKINHYKLEEIDYSKLKFVVIQTKYKDGWIFVRHNKRTTWEIPGGHIEKDEEPIEAAKRELYEETGALKYSLKPIEIYSVEHSGDASHGMLLYADVTELGKLPDCEIEEITIKRDLPKDLTYPLIQPYLFEKVIETISETTL